MKTLEIQERGTMLTDYFPGTPAVMLPLSIDDKTTCKEVLNQLEDEINQVWGHIEYTAEYHGFPIDTLEYCIAEQMAIMSDYVRVHNKSNQPYNADLDFTFDDSEDDIETPMAIFTIEFNEE